ncbi:MAG: tyrosine-protein phosphatase [Paludibacteraceae bacterium]|nr:tyrosine-protein phosphatase [Paludibacteraceae bacterium]
MAQKNKLHTQWLKAAILLPAVLMLAWATSCNDKESSNDTEPRIEGRIVSDNEFGAAMLSFTEDEMLKAGFSFGDVVTITVNGKEITMPFYDGFYALTGEFLCVAYPTYPSVCFTANNTGLPEELTGLEGQTVVIRQKEKLGKIDVQEAMSMKYNNERGRYPSDEAFANARAASAGNIASGRLYRCSSPFSNEINRAEYSSAFLAQHQVKSVLNLADTDEKMASYNMPTYSRTLWESGNVILCPLKADPTADEFNSKLIAALKELPSHPAPYAVHCVEGKDRTGYVCALLEGLCGATYDEIVRDYLITYENYYFINPQDDSEVCNALLTLRLNPCLMYYAGVNNESQLPNIDYAQAFSTFLLNHGMTQLQIDALVHALTE